MDNKTEKCWHVAAKGTVNGEKRTADTYEWCTEQAIALMVMMEYKYVSAEPHIKDFEIAYKETSNKQDKCEELKKEAKKNSDDFDF